MLSPQASKRGTSVCEESHDSCPTLMLKWLWSFSVKGEENSLTAPVFTVILGFRFGHIFPVEVKCKGSNVNRLWESLHSSSSRCWNVHAKSCQKLVMGLWWGYTMFEWWQACAWVTERPWCHLFWLFKTLSEPSGDELCMCNSTYSETTHKTTQPVQLSLNFPVNADRGERSRQEQQIHQNKAAKHVWQKQIWESNL